MPSLKAEVLRTTSNDERHPAKYMVDGNEKTFWCATGMYPQEVLVGFRSEEGKPVPVSLNRLKTVTTGIRKLSVHASSETQPIKFRAVLDVEVAEKTAASSVQNESFQVNAKVGSSVRFVKLVIQSGWCDFATIHSLVFEGDVEAVVEEPPPAANLIPNASGPTTLEPPITFGAVLDVEVAEKTAASSVQNESFQVNAKVGSSVRFVKLVIQSGWCDFATIHSLIFEGDVEAVVEEPPPAANLIPNASGPTTLEPVGSH
ncbi:Intraflagellar transport protein 25 [Diplonema papillatum]|nr:Intraflagellar transport protein 25 [Diplonema papillatum]